MRTFFLWVSVGVVVGGVAQFRDYRGRKKEAETGEKLSEFELWQKFVASLKELIAKHSVNRDEKGTPLPSRRFTVASRYDETDLQLMLDGKPVALIVYSKDANPSRRVTVAWNGIPIEYYRGGEFFTKGLEIEKRVLALPHMSRSAA